MWKAVVGCPLGPFGSDCATKAHCMVARTMRTSIDPLLSMNLPDEAACMMIVAPCVRQPKRPSDTTPAAIRRPGKLDAVSDSPDGDIALRYLTWRQIVHGGTVIAQHCILDSSNDRQTGVPLI